MTTHLWDKEEFSSLTPPDEAFSPVPDGDDPTQTQLCYEANILSFGDKSVFYPEGETTADYKLYHALFESNPDELPGYGGWARIDFNAPRFGPASGTLNPLPVVGMRIEARKNPASPLTWHGFSSDHAYERGANGVFNAPQ